MNYPLTIMLHSVGMESFPWVYAHLSEPVQSFEEKMLALKASGYKSMFFASIQGKEGGPKRLSLTFDDGYLDNWVFAFPILERLRMKATIFVTGEFVDPRPVLRPRMGKDGQRITEGGDSAGFLSWAEMRDMEASGLVDIQSHALTHTWYFTGPKIVDFWRPGIVTERKGAIWMLWNAFPDRKPFYMKEAVQLEQRIPYGTPIYEHAEALIARKFTPDPRTGEALIDYVRSNGDRAFFEMSDWRSKLGGFAQALSTKTRANDYGGFYESEGEYISRVQHELAESKRLIEINLRKSVTCLCWPRGKVTDQVIALARDIGYRVFTLPSTWKNVGERASTSLVPRISIGTEAKWKGESLGQQSHSEFIWRVRASEGEIGYRALSWLALRCRLTQRRVRTLLGFRGN